MNERELIKKLRALEAIKPDAGYVRNSRYLITQGGMAEQSIRQGIFSRGLSFAFSVALTSVFLIAVTIGGMTGYFKTLFLPSFQGVSNEALLTEANEITDDINIHLDDVEYFSNSVALAENGSSKQPTDTQDKGEEEIDNLLDEVISY